GVPVGFDTEQWSSLKRTHLVELECSDEIRKRFREDGYVYVKGLLPKEEVLDMRELYFSKFDSNMLNGSPREGIFSGHKDPCLPKHGVCGHPAYDFVRTEEFDAF